MTVPLNSRSGQLLIDAQAYGAAAGPNSVTADHTKVETQVFRVGGDGSVSTNRSTRDE